MVTTFRGHVLLLKLKVKEKGYLVTNVSMVSYI